MKITYHGTGTTFIEGVGHVSHGGTVDVPDPLGKALTTENPTDWKPAGSGKKKSAEEGS